MEIVHGFGFQRSAF